MHVYMGTVCVDGTGGSLFPLLAVWMANILIRGLNTGGQNIKLVQ